MSTILSALITSKVCLVSSRRVSGFWFVPTTYQDTHLLIALGWDRFQLDSRLETIARTPEF